MNISNTIIATPVWQMANTLPFFLRALDRLDPQPVEFVFAENNSTDGSYEMLENFKRHKNLMRFHYKTDVNDKNMYTSVARNRQALLDYAREKDPDFLIFLDADIIPTKDFIDRLTFWDVDIVAAKVSRLYPWGEHVATYFWNGKGRLETRPSIFVNTFERAATVGCACSCFARRVYQNRKLKFTPFKVDNWPEASEDHSFVLHAAELGYENWIDGTYELPHLYKLKNRINPWTVDPSGHRLMFRFNSETPKEVIK